METTSFPTHIIAVFMIAKTLLIALICTSVAIASGPIFILDNDAYDKGIRYSVEAMNFTIMTGIKQMR